MSSLPSAVKFRKFYKSKNFLSSVRFYVHGREECQKTVDKNEIDHFSGLKSKWWDKRDGPASPLHALNDLRIPFIRAGLINSGLLKENDTHLRPDYLSGVNILDLGSGGGILTLALAKLGCNVTAVEPSEELTTIAQSMIDKKKLSDKVCFEATSIEDYSKRASNKFDAVVCSEVIEHVTNKDYFLDASLSVLKPGGSVFFTTINKTIVAGLFTIIAAEYLLRILPVGTHSYDKLINVHDLEKALEARNCKTQMISGYMYNPFTNTFHWTATDCVLYSLHAVKERNTNQ